LVPVAGTFLCAYAVLALLSLGGSGSGDAVAVLLGTVLPLTLHAILGSVATAVAVALMYDAHGGSPTSVREAAAALGALWREIAAAALVAGLVSLLFVLPPLSILSAFLGLALFAALHGPPMVVEAVVIERLGLVQAWARARALLRGNWTRLLLYLLTAALGVRLLEGIVTSVAVTLVVETLGSAALRATVVTVDLLVLALLVPVVIAIVLAVFLDLRGSVDDAAAV
jgi:hypothetical protein